MDKVYYNYLNYVYGIYQRYTELKAEYESMPEGRLEMSVSRRDGNRYFIYLNGGRKYLSPKDINTIDLFKKKKKIEEVLNTAEDILSAILTPAVKKIINRAHSEKCSFPISVSEENYRRDELKHRTAHGEMVRSKSEVIIADILYKLGIPYVYEKKLKTREGAVYPDFTIRHPYEGNTYYLEHAGMLDKADYAADFCVKLSKYKSIGVSEDNYLIVTAEDKGNIDSNFVEKLLKSKFTFEKFLPLLDFHMASKYPHTQKKK